MSHLPDTVLTLAQAGALTPLDVHLAETLSRLTNCAEPAAVLGIAVASRAVGQGHVCADLEATVLEPPYDAEGEPIEDWTWPPLDEWLNELRSAPFVSTEPAPVPLVLEGTRLYLARYCRYEKMLAASLLRRSVGAPGEVDDALLEAGIARLFPNADGDEADQAAAARAAVTGSLAVISGGPGTGKTTTVARVLALVVEQLLAGGAQNVAIELLAPTGKAAQRLGEAIGRSLDSMPVDPEIAALIPGEAATIHRRLGVRMDDPTRFRHDADNPLAADIVLVDEASMVDLSLMARLVDAVPADARLIFLGDRDQLASIEAGAIFGDVCIAGARSESPLAQRTVHLTHRFRFDASSAVGGLAEAIRDGDGDRALAILEHSADEPAGPPSSPADDGGGMFAATEDEAPPVVQRVDPGAGTPVVPIASMVLAGYRRMLEAATPEAALGYLNEFRVLCAHRRGRCGVEHVGREIERVLVAEGLLPGRRRYARASDPWYPGRLVMVTQNDYQLDLFNGDVGIALASPGDPDRLRVWFPTGGEGARDVQPARLPAHETCFAMTIHKSQGSEFGGVAVVLPDKPSPIGTRELLYTAVTRARRDVTVVGTSEVIRDAIGRRIVRTSGLVELL